MKLTHQHHAKRRSGMTLLELTVVILVLLSLIAILFVGARAWKRGSDRAANIMNHRNVQQAVRGHENMNNLRPGDGLVEVDIFGQEAAGTDPEIVGYLRKPVPPVTTITYVPGSVVPVIGTLWMQGGVNDASYGFKSPTEYADW